MNIHTCKERETYQKECNNNAQVCETGENHVQLYTILCICAACSLAPPLTKALGLTLII